MIDSKGEEEVDDSCPKWLMVPSFICLFIYLINYTDLKFPFSASLSTPTTLVVLAAQRGPGRSGNEPLPQRLLSNPAPVQQMETHELGGCSHS